LGLNRSGAKGLQVRKDVERDLKVNLIKQ